jgi:anthranilate synthase component 1
MIEAQADPLKLPEAVFMFVSSMLVFDRASHTIKVVAHCKVPTAGASADDWAASYEAASSQIKELVTRLSQPLPADPSLVSRAVVSKRIPEPPQTAAAAAAGSDDGHRDTASSAKSAALDYGAWEAKSNVGRAGYEGFVSALQKHIVAGDIIQAVPSQRMRHDLAPGVTSVDLYRQLRRTNPSPYMFLLELGDDGTDSTGSGSTCKDGLSVIGASPEMLCKVTAGGEVETHPIAGTRRRGRTEAEDDAMAADLIGDPKERAEHVMLVDLGRNDCGRVCAAGSVKVERLMGIERYSHVMHIVSRVTGRLAEGKTSMDAFRSIFPAGTVSGAPKVRAIELVAGMEPERRYVYAGAVGCWGYDGALDTAIAIRTIFVAGGGAYLQAGGGIVHDSVPGAEYIETINKLAASMKAVDAAVEAARRA